MSLKALVYVKDLRVAPTGAPLSQGEKLVLFILADSHHPDRKFVWPSVPTIAADALMEERSARRILRALEEKKVLKALDLKTGRGQTRAYIFLEIDPDPELQHTMNHVSCPACQKAGVQGLVGDIRSPLNKDAAASQGGLNRPPSGGVKGGVIGDLGGQNGGLSEPERGTEGGPKRPRNKEGTVNRSATVKPSASDGAEADPRHAPIRAYIQQRHAEANSMPRELVPWSGREGAALAKLLEETPAMTVEHAQRCTANYYRSDVNISAHPATWIPQMRAYWFSDTNQYDTPRPFDKDEQRKKGATVGVWPT